MIDFLKIAVPFYPLLVLLLSVMSLNVSKPQNNIASNKWIYLSWLNISICFILFAAIGIGLDSFFSIPTELAKELRIHKALYFTTCLILAYLQKFNGLHPTKPSPK